MIGLLVIVLAVAAVADAFVLWRVGAAMRAMLP